MPLIELVRQNEAVPVELSGCDRIPALQDEISEIVEIDGDAEAIPDAAANLERLLNECFAPRELAPAVIRLTQVAQNDADLPVVANGTSDWKRLFLIGHRLVVIALAVGHESQIVETTRDTGLIFQHLELLQRLSEEQAARSNSLWLLATMPSPRSARAVTSKSPS